jgi:succinate dehydrogenase/fumarate reductase cytochrome b subunit
MTISPAVLPGSVIEGTDASRQLSYAGNLSDRSVVMGSMFNGLIGLVILALDIWAILNVIKSSAETGIKILWILLIVLLPVIGLIIWALMGPRGNVRI